MFRVHVPAEQQAIYVDVSGQADVVYTVINISPISVAGLAEIEPELGAEPMWFRVAEPRHRQFRGEEAQQFKVEVTIPADTPAGIYGFRLVAVNEDDPDEDYAEGETVTLHWDPGQVKRIDRAVIGLLTLVGIAGLLAVSAVIYLVANREIRPRETLRAANRAAEAGQWADYWDCWTEEGQDELLVRAAGLLEKTMQTLEQSQDIEAWIRGYGVYRGQFEGGSRQTMAGDPNIVETATRLKERFHDVGRTERDFFVGAAQWLEDAREADSVEAHSQAEFRKEFQYELAQAVDIDDDLAQQVAIWDGSQTSPAATDAGRTAEQTALRIIFHKTGRRWLIHDVYPEQLTRCTVWVPLPGRKLNTDSSVKSALSNIIRIEATRRRVATPDELEYEDAVRIYYKNEVKLASLEKNDGLFIKINGVQNEVDIVSPFLIIREPNKSPEVFFENGATVTVGDFLYRPWSDVGAILKRKPFHSDLLFWCDGQKKVEAAFDVVGQTTYYVNAVYLGPEPDSQLKAVEPAKPPEEPVVPAESSAPTAEPDPAQKPVTSKEETSAEETPAGPPASAAPALANVSTSPPGAVMLNARQELRLYESDSESSEFLIIELVEEDPLSLDTSLQHDLAREIALASQTPAAKAPRQASAEAKVRNALERNGFDYFIKYSYGYEPKKPSVALEWVFHNGRKRLKVTLNRFGAEFQPTHATGLWGANSLAFRQDRGGLRLVIGNDRGDVLFESNLQFDLPQNIWEWSGSQRGIASLRPELDVPLLQPVSLRGGASLYGDSRPVLWSGTPTVMPFNKMDFALSEERSAAERAFGSVAISPDSQWLAGADSRGRLRIWRLSSDGKWSLTQEYRLGGYLRSNVPDMSLQMRSIAFNADASYLAVAVTVTIQKEKTETPQIEKPTETGSVLVLHRHAKALPYVVVDGLNVGATAPRSVAFSRDRESNRLAAGLANGKIVVWTKAGHKYGPKDNSPRDISTMDDTPVLSLAFGSGDRTDWLAVGQASGTLRLGAWNAGNWKMILAKPSAGQDEGALHAVAFSPQGAILAGLSESGVRLWQLKDLSVEKQPSNGP